jgi:hypothetical protein
MPTCPLCETSQPAGDACDTCGRAFAPGAAPAGAVPPLPELEPARHAPAAAPPEAMPDLEPTAAPAAGEAGGAALEGLEPTAHAAGTAAAAPEPVEVEPTAAAPVPDARPRGPVVCRYCGAAPEGPERVCRRCGLRLPLPRVAPRAEPVDAPCSECGVPGAGARCPACGARRAAG